MAQLPTNRTTANTAAEHVADHDELHRLHDLFEATTPATFEQVTNKGAASGYTPLDSGGFVPLANIPGGLGTWTGLGNLSASVTLVGDSSVGGWTDLGNIGAATSVTG